MTVRKIDEAEDAIEQYGKFRPLILRALEYDHETEEADILKALDDRHATMWVNETSFGIFSISEFNGKTNCLIRIAGGNIEDLFPSLDTVEVWAKKWDACRFVVCGRRGWNRILKAKGWLEAVDDGKTIFFKNF